MESQPNYYAVIPASVRYADIPDGAKLLYGEITALCSKEGYCWASNAYFAKLYNRTPDTISVWVRHLRDEGFIEVEIDKSQGNFRRLTLTVALPRKIAIPIAKNHDTYSEKSLHPIAKNYDSFTINSKESSKKKRKEDLYISRGREERNGDATPIVTAQDVAVDYLRPPAEAWDGDNVAYRPLRFVFKVVGWWDKNANEPVALAAMSQKKIAQAAAVAEYLRPYNQPRAMMPGAFKEFWRDFCGYNVPPGVTSITENWANYLEWLAMEGEHLCQS